MGESIVDLPKYADKVGETAASNSLNPALEVSVSFGRFENDSLSWEKFSAFSPPNKYLEEVEKCATPGSVAQKRAYFEAHYKRIAARKAEELLEQEKQMQDDPLRSDDQNDEDQIGCGTHFEIDLTNSQSTVQGFNQETNLNNEMSSTHVDDDDLKEEDVITIECQSSLFEGEKEEADSPNLNKPEEFVLVKEVETIPADSQGLRQIPKTLDNDIGNAPDQVKEEKDRSELPKTLDNDTGNAPEFKEEKKRLELRKTLDNVLGNAPEVKKEKKRLELQKGSQKVTPVSKERNLAKVMKKPVSPITKTPQNSTPRVSKPISTSTPRSASRTLVKKGNSPSRSKNSSTEETTKVPPKALHMSLSLEPVKCNSAPVTTTRKSFIMEKMGDKDIVKRAFKTFQNNFNQPKSSSEERSSTPKQLSVKGKESRVSTSVPLPRENGGSLKTGALDKRSAKAAPSSFGSRSDERAERRKEFSKKLEAKSNAKEAEKTHFQPKSKEQKEAEIKKLGQSLNSKATPMLGFHRGQKISKITSEKEGSKHDIHR